MKKSHLKLIVSNKKEKNLIDKLWNWFTKPRFFPLFVDQTYLKKKETIQKYLTLKYADLQLTTGNVGLFPLCEAINEVNRLERNGQINSYYRIIKKKMAVKKTKG